MGVNMAIMVIVAVNIAMVLPYQYSTEDTSGIIVDSRWMVVDSAQ